MTLEPAAFLHDLGARLAGAGLDLVQPFSVLAYNQDAPFEWRLPGSRAEGSPWAERTAGDALGVLVGNTRALFAPFLASLPADGSPEPDPLDRYVERAVATALEGASPGRQPLLLVHSHTTEPRAWPMQRIADAVGLARLGPAHLNVHPLHGPWFALRSLLVVDLPPPAALPAPAPRVCDNCPAPCVPALKLALQGAAQQKAGPHSSATGALSPVQQLFLAVRDACPVGQGSRYGARQIAYHYARRSALLYGDEPVLGSAAAGSTGTASTGAGSAAAGSAGAGPSR